MSKNVLLIIIGILVGALIMGAGVSVFFKNAVPTPSLEELNKTVSTIQNEMPDPIAIDTLIKTTKETTKILPPSGLVTEEYSVLINRILNTLNQAAINNNNEIVPLMKKLEEKGKSGDWNGIFDLASDIKQKIGENKKLVASAQADIASLRTINDQTTIDDSLRTQTGTALTAANSLANAFNRYFDRLGEFLTGTIPTQDLINNLNANIVILTNAGKDSQEKFNILLETMHQKITAPKK